MTREATARFRLSFDSSAFTFATRNSWGWGGGRGDFFWPLADSASDKVSGEEAARNGESRDRS